MLVCGVAGGVRRLLFGSDNLDVGAAGSGLSLFIRAAIIIASFGSGGTGGGTSTLCRAAGEESPDRPFMENVMDRDLRRGRESNLGRELFRDRGSCLDGDDEGGCGGGL